MARMLLTHIVGAPDLDPELNHMTLAANAWVLDYLGNSRWLIEAPDAHALRVCLLPGWALDYSEEEGGADGEGDEPSGAEPSEAPPKVDAAQEALF